MKLAQQVARLEQEFASSSASTPHRTDSEAKLVQMENDVFSKTLDTLSAEVARLKADNDKLRDSVKEKQTDLSRSLAEANSFWRRSSGWCSSSAAARPTSASRTGARRRRSSTASSFRSSSASATSPSCGRSSGGPTSTRCRSTASSTSSASTPRAAASTASASTSPSPRSPRPPSHRFVFDRLYTLFDRDGDEKVDFGEFAGGLSVLCAGSREEKLKLVFAFVDADGNGSLSKAELMGFFTTTLLVVTQGLRDGTTLTAEQISLLEAQTSSEIESCFAQIDKDHDGKLDFDEFRSGVEGSQSQLQSLLEIFTFTATSGSADAPQPSRRLKGDGGKDDADDEEDLVTEGDCAVQ